MSKNIKTLKNFLELDITKVFSNPNNPRKNIDDKELQELALSIKTHGLINPITVVEADNNQYMIVSGHRRYEALKINNDKTIIVNVIDVDSYQLNELVLIENIQRSDLTDFEKAKYILTLWNTGIYEKKSHLATAIGKSPAYISHVFSCLKLEDSILTDLEENKTNVPLSVLEELSKVKDKDTQKNLYTKYLNNEITRDEIRILKPENQIIKKENFARENKEIEENKINLISEESIVLIAKSDDNNPYELDIFKDGFLRAYFMFQDDSIQFKKNTKYKITIEEIKEVPQEIIISKPFDTFEPIEIKHIEFCSNDVYIEYVDNDSETISYSKAKQILKNSTQKSIPYSLIDSEKSCNFINALPGFSQSNNCLVRKG